MLRRPIRGTFPLAHLFLVGALFYGPTAQHAGAQVHDSQDFSPQSDAWNGLSSLLQICEQLGLSCETPNQISLPALTEADAILILNPSTAPPTQELAQAIESGLNVALANDFGQGSGFMQALSIGDHAVPREGLVTVAENSNLALAIPQHRHALTTGVGGVVTNHPRALRHASLVPVLSFGQPTSAFVLTGTIGDGRFVALSDPSVLINNMLEFPGNHRFASNLLTFLSESGERRLWIATPATSLGESAAEGRQAEAFDAWLHRLSAYTPPAGVLQVLAILVPLLAITFVSGTLPRRSPYEPAASRHRREHWLKHRYVPGIGSRQYYFALMTYGSEWLDRLSTHFALPVAAHSPSIAQAMEHSGTSESLRVRFQNLARELQELQRKDDRPPRVTRSRFEAFVAGGEALLEQVLNKKDKHD